MKSTALRRLFGLAAFVVACFIGLSGCTETLTGHDAATIEETSEDGTDWNGRILEHYYSVPPPYLPPDTSWTPPPPPLPPGR